MTARVRIAHLGAAGSFSEAAARAYAQRHGVAAEPLGRATFAEVLAALAGGEAELAVLPVASTGGGLVRAALDALAGRAVEVVDEVVLPVRLALLARPGTPLAAIERVASHPQAFRQAERSLARLLPGRERVACPDTASAARDVASGALAGPCAALASAVAGARYGLVLLAEGMEDEADNRTFFAVLRRAAGARVE